MHQMNAQIVFCITVKNQAPTILTALGWRGGNLRYKWQSTPWRFWTTFGWVGTLCLYLVHAHEDAQAVMRHTFFCQYLIKLLRWSLVGGGHAPVSAAPAMAPEEVQLCKCLIKKKMYSIKFHRVPLSPQTLRNKAAIKECLCTLKHKGKSSWCYWVSVNLLRNKWNWVGLYCNWTVREGWSLTSGLTGSWKGALRTLLRIRRVSRSHFYKQANKRERH